MELNTAYVDIGILFPACQVFQYYQQWALDVATGKGMCDMLVHSDFLADKSQRPSRLPAGHHKCGSCVHAPWHGR